MGGFAFGDGTATPAVLSCATSEWYERGDTSVNEFGRAYVPNRCGEYGVGSTNTGSPVTISASSLPVTGPSVRP